LTISRATVCFAPVSARRIVALLLAALWLPAMLHCRLEAAGLLFESNCCDSTPCSPQPVATDHGCTDDSCEVVEGEFTAPDAFVLKAPSLEHCTNLLFSPTAPPSAELIPAPDTGVVELTTAPPELTRPWVLMAPGPVSPRAP